MWIYKVHCRHPQRGDAGHEEVVATTQFDEVRKMSADEGRVGGAAVALNDEAASSSVVASEDVLVFALCEAGSPSATKVP